MSGYRGVIRALMVRAEMKRYLVYDTMLLQVYDAGYSYGSAVFNAPRPVREAMDVRAKIIMEQARKHEIAEDAVILTRERYDKLLALIEEGKVMREAIADEIKYQMNERDNVNGGLMMAVRGWDKLMSEVMK